MDKKVNSLKLMGASGIVREIIKIIQSERQSLLIITVLSIVPPILLTMVNIWGAELVFTAIDSEESHGSRNVPYELYGIEFLLVEVAWTTFFYLGLMPSVTAVVYTVARFYSGEQESFIESLPTVWKRMLITCLWYLLMSVIIVLGFGVVLLSAYLIPFIISFVIGLAVFGCVGMYVTMVWHLSIVVSVVEENFYGLAGLKRSRRLIQGKRLTTWGLFMSLIVIVGLFNFGSIFVGFYYGGFGARTLYAVVYVVLGSVITLMWEVTQSVLYFVCKAHLADSGLDEGLALEVPPQFQQALPSAGGNRNIEINNTITGPPKFLTS